MTPESVWLLPLLFITGLAAGLIDSIAGGGGLLALPVLLSMGLPTTLALGTNKFQSCVGTFTASHHYVHKGVVDLKDALPGVAMTFVFACIGTWTVQSVDPAILNYVIPFLLLAILVYAFFTPDLGKLDTHPRLSRRAFYALSGIAFGFYDGFFGPGVGSFWAMAFVLGLGFNLRKATGYTKVMNLASNIAAIILFSIGGNVWYAGGVSMAAGQIVGARLGSGLVIRKGSSFIRPIYITVVVLTMMKLFFDKFIH